MFMAVVPATAMALGSHEVLVLVNGKLPDSLEIAGEFVKLRKVPEINVVRLDLPASVTESPSEISREDFTKLIWAPASQAMQKRGIEDHILAWVYSVDFPIMIKTTPPISIQGLTFLRNKLPDPKDVDSGAYSSPLFAGPDNPAGRAHFPQTFDVYHKWLGEEMPLPSMMLGYTGKGGNAKETVLKCLKNGATSDGTAPSGTVYFVTSEDVRSTCRQWQYPVAQMELRVLGVESVISKEFPSTRRDIIGLMMGAASVNPEQDNCYLPGCMAEHLTSAAAVFHSANQTKLSAWIEAGATASAGTITEPFSNWAKFPNARFFVHYASGCCIAESFFQSIKCPLQILIVGDPLAQPWALKAELTLHGLEKKALSGTVSVRVEIKAEPGKHYSKFVFLLDGKVVPPSSRSQSESELRRTSGNERTLELDTTRCQNGAHTLRAVAYRTGLVRSQVFVEKKIVISNQ